VGADVEPLDDAPPLWDMLTADEAEQLRAVAQSRQPEEWLRRWTAKEAHAKRLGYARSADPAGIETMPDGPGRLLARSREGVSTCWMRMLSGRVEAVALAPG
jgi:4'-phosphopantetheinyl transferase